MGKRRCSDEKKEKEVGRKKSKKMLPPPAPVPHARIDRSMSCTSEISMSLVSPRVRETLLNMERVKVHDPFSAENQEIIQEFRDSVDNTSLEDLNLTEMALLLRGVMSLWKRQTGTYMKDVHNLAVFVTNGKVKDVLIEPIEDKDDGDKCDEGEENNGKEKEGEKETNATEVEKETAVAVPGDGGNGETEQPDSEKTDEMGNGVTQSLETAEHNLNATADTAATENSSIPQDGSQTCENFEAPYSPEQIRDILNENPDNRETMNTRKRRSNYADLIDPSIYRLLGADPGANPFKLKKPRKERLMPSLTPYLDIPFIEVIDEDMLPPKLFRFDEIPKVVRKRSKNTQGALGEDGDQSELLNCQPNDNVGLNIEDHIPAALLSSDGVDKLAQAEFSPDDVAEIQRWINQLHYLPFICELTNEEVKRTFEILLARLSVIFKKYGVPVNGHLLTSAKDVCAKISSLQDSQQGPVEKSPDNPGVGDPGGAQSSQSKEGDPLVDSDLTVMERTTEKTLRESRDKLREMILEMQKSIVPKFARIPLIEENTLEFFRRVKLFEEKMKKVLACEEKKEEFDVRKYEMEVLDAANKETQEMESSESSHSQDMPVPSPLSSCSSHDKFAGFDDGYLGLGGYTGVASPSCSETSDSQKWVPLTQIFTHMKRMEKPEAARVFYAVLALLSFQNLDIRYENHYSAESAAVTTNSLDHAQDGKYPRGLKIMASRCPDVDVEEVYLAPLTSQSRTNAFRQLEFRESGLGIARMRADSVSSYSDEVVNGDLTHDIEREFVRTECTVYTGELFKSSKKSAPRVRSIKPPSKKANVRQLTKSFIKKHLNM